MMRYADNLLLLLKRILLLLFVYFLCRLFFLLFNRNFFSDVSLGNLLIAFIHGMRFDLSAIIILNLPLIALHFFPINVFYNKKYQKVMKWVFALINIPPLLFSCIDFIYFRFTFRRTTADVLSMLGLGGDVVKLLPAMFLDFWYVLLIWITLSIFLIIMFSRITSKHFENYKFRTGLSVRKIAFHFIFLILIVIGFRGGIQYKPINILSAGEINSTQAAPLVLNTPFTIIKSWGEKQLTEFNYFEREKATEIFSPLHQYKPEKKFTPLNVVIVILESFSKEYIGSYNQNPGYTPFLDSLISQSLSFPDAFANGKRSIDGIPAIVASIPALSHTSFITSAYSGNTFNSIANLLKKKKYSTAFFHGGNNGTMGFDHFSRMAGFDNYYGRREYDNDKDYDGAWGIYDEPFLQFTAGKINSMKSPFLACVFTISSHHPYAIPEKYNGKFKKGTLPIHESIQYADYSLRKFFQTVSSEAWFDNTLFVITSDHTALSEVPFYHTRIGMYSIPILYYQHGAMLSGLSQLTTQQSDIVPSILYYLNYDEPFVAFGESVFDTTAFHCAVNFQNDVYQIIRNGFSLQADVSSAQSLYHFVSDSLLKENLIYKNLPIEDTLEIKLKALIQQYNHAMIHNKLHPD